MEKIKCFGFDMDYTLAGKLNTHSLDVSKQLNLEHGLDNPLISVVIDWGIEAKYLQVKLQCEVLLRCLLFFAFSALIVN